MSRTPKSFDGFPPGKFQFQSIPEPFFTDLLPLIDDLAELKVLLFCFWTLPQKGGAYPHLLREDFVENETLIAGLKAASPDRDPLAALEDALLRSIERGALLVASVEIADEPRTLYFVNTERGRTAIQQINAGNWQTDAIGHGVQILPARPNIYKLYEENIGPLTPMIADDLKDTEAEFPAAWIEDAMRIAVTSNKRSLRYIRAILERWQREGKGDDSPALEEDGKRYVSGKYGNFIEH